MGTSNVSDNRTYGQAIVSRMAGVEVPEELQPSVATFEKIHGAYEAASVKVDAAKRKRDEALEAAGEADDEFDSSVEALANAAVGAGIGKRRNPFAQRAHGAALCQAAWGHAGACGSH
jgi:hypothetical protein